MPVAWGQCQTAGVDHGEEKLLAQIVRSETLPDPSFPVGDLRIEQWMGRSGYHSMHALILWLAQE